MVNAVSSGGIGASSKPCDPGIIKTTGCEIMTIAGNANNKINRRIIPNDGNTGATTVTTFTLGGIDIEYRGSVTAATDVTSEAVSSIKSTTGTLNAAGGMFGTIIIDIIALMFIWLAFMAAKGVSKVVSKAIQPFEDMGNKV
jgi:hypothetical protein